MAGVTGLEPAASGVTGRHSNQLSYTPGMPGLQAAVMYSTPYRVSSSPDAPRRAAPRLPGQTDLPSPTEAGFAKAGLHP